MLDGEGHEASGAAGNREARRRELGEEKVGDRDLSAARQHCVRGQPVPAVGRARCRDHEQSCWAEMRAKRAGGGFAPGRAAGTALQPGTSRRGRRGRGPRWLAHRARTALGAEVTFEQNVQSNRVHRCEGVGVQRRRAPHGWARSRVLPWCNQPGGSRLLSGGRCFRVPRGLSASFFKRVASVGPVRRLVTGSEGLPRQQS